MLVVVGLIIGGILLGQTLIKSSEIRAQISDIQKLDAAINTFKLKYNCLPGDCAEATQLFTGASQPELVTNGNGDGKICTEQNSNCPTTSATINWRNSNGSNYVEWTGVFDHLAAAGLWGMKQYDERVNPTTYPDVVCPSLRFKSYWEPSDTPTAVMEGCMTVGYIPGGYGSTVGGNQIVLGAYGGRGQMPAGTYPGINAWEAFAIDSKIDDGFPFTGRAYTMNANNVYASYYCHNNSNAYRTETNPSNGGGGPRLRTCALYIGASF